MYVRKPMKDEENYPNLKRPVHYLVRLILALIRLLIARTFGMIYFMLCLLAGLFIRKDINSYKLNVLVSLVVNFINRVL